MISVSRMTVAFVCMTLLIVVGAAQGQGINEDFDGVTGTGGGPFFSGSGSASVDGWDDGLDGESATAGTENNTQVGSASAFGDPTGGVDGSGAGVIELLGAMFNILDEGFSTLSGTGGGVFLDGDGATPNTFNFTTNWDDGIEGEGAFAGTFDGGILIGSVSAAGLPSGGDDGMGAGQITVDNVDITPGNWFAGLQFDAGPLPGGLQIVNPNFDDDGPTLEGWEIFSAGFNVLAETTAPLSAPGVCKMFGQFTGSPNSSGIFQSVTAEPGQTWEIDVFSQHVTGDSLVGSSNFMLMRIEFLDEDETVLDQIESTILDTSSPVDEWIDNDPIQLTAPAGTVEMRPVFTFEQPLEGAFEGGAGLLDDVRVRLVGGPGVVDLSGFALNADILGEADGAGESLGDVQLRIEDPDGGRIIFRGTATSNWQTLGGPLDTGIEADMNGVPTEGAFDTNAAGYTVVVAFDNEFNAPWGTGGELNVDDIQIGNTDTSSSRWFADLSFEGLTTLVTDPSRLLLAADVLGDVVGGAYELVLTGFRLTQAGLDESFASVTGTGGGVFLSFDDFNNGATTGFTSDFDDGIEGEGAFGGLFGIAEIFPGGGFSASGLTNGGTDGTGSAQVLVENIGFGPGGGWFAGIDFGNQSLASTDLSQIMMTADIRGTTASGGALGPYEFRIEDAQGDRLFFSMMANGAFQAVGGPLSTATEGGAAGGGGDGVFNLDSPSYTVVVAFEDSPTWAFGGSLEIDNLFLTPIDVENEIGDVRFANTSDQSFQSIGGILSGTTSDFGDFFEQFDDATGIGGGPIGTGNTEDWDTGIENETAFFGTFGNAVVNVGASVEGCLDCGVDDGPAAQLTVTDVPPGTGGWFSGVFFSDITADLTGDLSEIMLTATVKGEAEGAGESLGSYFLRIEDDDLTVLVFNTDANGTFQQVGGPLSDASIEQIEAGDGVFNRALGTYNITVGFVGSSSNWGPGGQLTVDDWFLTGVSLADADSISVKVAFADEIATWGTGGSLTVDNLRFLAAGNTDGDNDVDLLDFGNFQDCFDGMNSSGVNCDNLDLDDNGSLELNDYSLFQIGVGTAPVQ